MSIDTAQIEIEEQAKEVADEIRAATLNALQDLEDLQADAQEGAFDSGELVAELLEIAHDLKATVEEEWESAHEMIGDLKGNPAGDENDELTAAFLRQIGLHGGSGLRALDRLGKFLDNGELLLIDASLDVQEAIKEVKKVSQETADLLGGAPH